ncbi:uncharacterized protein LOC130815034 [Amaranthus tricolor]|uniref:uncharacterized protein LOC130815034 n=1 Tax=Amaranthus tricolor TaxID=29722 RepID=UPI00258E74E2|nr:uncharacterized protein LOC130815034 [Amaranthus tricolor]
MPKRPTTEAIHLLRRFMEKYRERKKDLYLVFIDLEKAYDNIPRSIVWDTLKNRGDHTKEEANSKLEAWREALEGKGLRISHTKTEYLRCNFSGTNLIGEPKWRVATGVLCDKKFPRRLKGKFYRVAIRSALLYGTKCFPVKKVFEQRMKVTEMRMLRWMYGNTIMDRIRNQEFRKKLGVAPLSAKM